VHYLHSCKLLTIYSVGDKRICGTGQMTVTGQKLCSWTQTCPGATLSTTNPIWAGLGLKPDLCSEKQWTASSMIQPLHWWTLQFHSCTYHHSTAIIISAFYQLCMYHIHLNNSFGNIIFYQLQLHPQQKNHVFVLYKAFLKCCHHITIFIFQMSGKWRLT